MEITGRLASKGEVKQFESGFIVEEFYIDATRFDQNTGQKYPNHIKMQNNNEKINLENFNIGDMIKFTASISGRFYVNSSQENRHSQSVVAYKAELMKDNKDLPDLEGVIEFPYF